MPPGPARPPGGPGESGGPPGPTYPPMYPWMYPPRRSRWGRLILMILLIGALVVSIGINLAHFGASVITPSGPRQIVVTDGDPEQKIAIIPVAGFIDESSFQDLDQHLASVEKDSTIKAVVIEVDTPGGLASASDEMYNRINVYRANVHGDRDKGHPIVIAMRGMATSGGYFLSCAGDHVFAEPECLTGNIGVIMERFNFSKLTDKWGVDDSTITDTEGTYKYAGSPFRPESPEDRKYLQDIADGIFAPFKKAVKDGRGAKLQEAKFDDIFTGKAFLAPDAKDRGLIDEIGYTADACAYAATKAGLSGPMIVRFEEPPMWLKLLGADSKVPAGRTGGGNVTINGVNVDSEGLRELISPRPMFLWRGQ
jgi:protease IV